MERLRSDGSSEYGSLEVVVGGVVVGSGSGKGRGYIAY